jgi:hypothetical protein
VTLDSRERWIKAAAGWEARADQFARDTMPVSLAMVEAIEPDDVKALTACIDYVVENL